MLDISFWTLKQNDGEFVPLKVGRRFMIPATRVQHVQEERRCR